MIKDRLLGSYDWLLKSEPWVRYNTLIYLQGKPENSSEAKLLRKEIAGHPKVKAILDELENWPGVPLKRHNDSSHLIHKLAFVSDLGLKKTDTRIKKIIDKILAKQSDEGPFHILSNVDKRYGGSGKDELVWFLCDAPLIIYALAQFGLTNDKKVKKAMQYLLKLQRENGWPCAVSKELGKFRGPGRKDDPCPYANFLMVKAISKFTQYYDSKELKIGSETILNLWDERKRRRPYLFAMGTDFQKLKAPLVWYDVLHVLDVLSNFPFLQKDKRVNEMLDIIEAKATPEGKFIPESIYRAWKDWDFGQKKIPSPWITFLVYRIFYRLGRDVVLSKS